MKKIFAFTLVICSLMLSTAVHAQQDKSKRASPPAKVSKKIKSGATITIDYSQPSLKGRTIGKDVEPKVGEVWRMGANEATVFETDKDVKVEGQVLPAGKYSLFGISGEDGYILIFNKAWKIWGTEYAKNKEQDQLRVTVQPRAVKKIEEQLKYEIDKSGKVTLLWGNMAIDFNVR